MAIGGDDDITGSSQLALLDCHFTERPRAGLGLRASHTPAPLKLDTVDYIRDAVREIADTTLRRWIRQAGLKAPVVGERSGTRTARSLSCNDRVFGDELTAAPEVGP